MSDVVVFDKQKEWQDLGDAIYTEFGLSVMTSSVSASQIPTVAMFEDVKNSLSYSNILESGNSPIVVLDVMITEADRAEGETRTYDDQTLEEIVRGIVARYQAYAKERDCHITGNFLTVDHVVTGVLLRVYRNQDFPCKGHPEILHGKPIGMYHCDKCGVMQMAGTFHSSDEDEDEENV